MIVADASAVVAALLRAGPTRDRLANDAVHAPHLVDTEVTDVLRKLVLRGVLRGRDGERALGAWKGMGISRHPTVGMLDRVWELRDILSAYDAAYVALAEVLDCGVVTADQRLAAASGPRCMIEVVPR